MTRSSRWVLRGTIAGVVAATVVAAWFLALDLLAGEPFRTPAFLSRVLFGAGEVVFAGGVVVLYTIAHYLAFIIVGIATAWVVERLEAVPPILLGLALGFLLFDLVFYGSLLVTGVDVIDGLGWPALLTGNLIAGVALLVTLTLMGGATAVNWRETLAEYAVIREGLLAGLVGAALVALWFLVIDVIAGRPFFTPAALGSALLSGARSPAEVEIAALPILGYTVVHVFAFLVTGLVAAAIFAAAEKVSEVVLLGGVLLFFVFEAFSIGILAIVSQWLLDTLSWWSVAIANLVAAAGMGVFLMRRHPRLMHNLRHHELEEELAHDGEAPARVPGVHTSELNH